MEMPGLAFGSENLQHGPRDGQFVAQLQRSESQKRTGHVKRSRQDAGFHRSAAALRVEKNQLVEEFDFVRGAYAAVKIREISATSQRNVLAIINVFAIGQNVGSSAATKKWFLLEQPHAPARFSQRDAARQSRQPAADHDHAFQ
jgi:hypothetical protein